MRAENNVTEEGKGTENEDNNAKDSADHGSEEEQAVDLSSNSVADQNVQVQSALQGTKVAPY